MGGPRLNSPSPAWTDGRLMENQVFVLPIQLTSLRFPP